MTVSQPERNQNQHTEDTRLSRASKLTLVAGLLTLVTGFLLPLFSRNELPPYALQVTFGSALLQLAGAFIISRRRISLGLIVFFTSAPTTILYVISQNTGIGILVTVGMLVIYMIFLPQVLADARQIIRGQVSALILAGLLMLADLYWPLPRPEVAASLFNVTAVLLLALLLIFAFLTVRQFPTFGLRGKLISTTVFVAILAVIAVAFGVNSFTRNALTIEAGEQLEALTDSQAILIGELLFRELSTLQSLSLNDSLLAAVEARNASYSGSDAEILAAIAAQDAQWAAADTTDSMVTAVLQNALSTELRKFQDSFPENDQLFITDQHGALLAATNPVPRYSQIDEAWWQETYNLGFGTTYFSEPKINERNGAGFIEVSLPLFSTLSNGTKRFAGALHATYRLNALEDLMAEAKFGETGQIKMHFPNLELAINDAGRLVINTDNMLAKADLEAALLSNEDFILVNTDGPQIFLAAGEVNTLNHQPVVDELGWAISVQQAEREALAAVEAQQRLNMIFGVIVVIVAGGAAAFVGRQLTEPILRLTAVAENVTAGDLLAHAPVDSQDEIGILANAFNSMTMQVRESITMLEDRVQDRTRALETSIEVGRRITTVMETENLVVEVVNQVRDAFNYYHAHIYLIDSLDQNRLRMAGGTGAAGQEMLAHGHKLNLGQGLVGRAAATRQPVLVPDVSQEPGWLPNPLLPDTKAEIAVPIMRGNRVLGVLDVQHNVANGLIESDVALLESIALQVAIALQNARSYQNAQYRAEKEAQVNDINRKIQATTELDAALQVAADEVKRVFMAKDVRVQLTASQSLPAMVPSDTVLRFPVEVRRECVGYLELVDVPVVDDETEALLTAVTKQLGPHIENLQLVAQTEKARADAEKRSEEMALINRIMSAVTASFDLPRNLHTIATELARAISVSHVGIALMTEDKEFLQVITEYPLPETGSADDVLGQLLPIKGYPLTERALETRKFVVAYDAQNNPLTAPIHDILRQRHVQTLAVVPMVIGGEIFGTVGFDLLDGDRIITNEEMALAETIVYHTTTVVQNARLFTQTQRALAETNEQARRLAILNELSETISRMDTLDEIVAFVMEKAPEMIQAARISLHLIDETDATMLRVAGVSGEVASTGIGELIPLAGSPMADALAERQLISGVFDTDEEVLQAYFAPLYASGQPVGTFNMAVLAETPLQEGTQQILMQIASVLGTTIENRRLFNRTRARADREQILNNITRKIQSTVTMEAALQTAVTELGQALGASTQVELAVSENGHA